MSIWEEKTVQEIEDALDPDAELARFINQQHEQLGLMEQELTKLRQQNEKLRECVELIRSSDANCVYSDPMKNCGWIARKCLEEIGGME